MFVLPAALLIGIVCCLSVGSGLPTPQNVGQTLAQSQHHSNSQVLSAADGYVVQISQNDNNGLCLARLRIAGNGINKTVDYPCQSAPSSIINLNKSLLVGEEWFTDQPKVLVHLTGTQCQKEVYTEQNGKISASQPETLGHKECEDIKAKIVVLKENQKKWNEWLYQQQQQQQQAQQQFQQEAQKQFQQLQQNLQWFQNQMVGPHIGFPFFGY